jgi:hypothetical protein
MKSIDEMTGMTNKGKTLLKELKLERLVNEDYLKKLYEKHKKFFIDPKSSPIPSIETILIGDEILKDLEKQEHNIEKLLGKYYNENISQRANAMAASQAVFFYITYQLIEIGLMPQTQNKTK